MLRNKLGILSVALVMGALVSCGGAKEPQKVTAVGSSALQPLAQAAAEEYMKDHADINITVQGGGSGTGLSQIAAGSVQIGNSDIFAEAKKIDPSNLEDNKVAIVGMGPVVNKDVKVDNLTSQQLKDIFEGKVTNWNEVGGQDLKIVVINRAQGSGTRATFERFALDGESAMQAQEQDNSGSVQKIVATTPGAISYLAFSYYNDQVKPLSIDGVAPEAKNIEDNSWKIWSYEHMYTKKNPDKATKDFIDYVKSDAVQNNIVPKLGYIAVTGMKVERDAEGNITQK